MTRPRAAVVHLFCVYKELDEGRYLLRSIYPMSRGRKHDKKRRLYFLFGSKQHATTTANPTRERAGTLYHHRHTIAPYTYLFPIVSAACLPSVNRFDSFRYLREGGTISISSHHIASRSRSVRLVASVPQKSVPLWNLCPFLFHPQPIIRATLQPCTFRRLSSMASSPTLTGR